MTSFVTHKMNTTLTCLLYSSHDISIGEDKDQILSRDGSNILYRYPV